MKKNGFLFILPLLVLAVFFNSCSRDIRTGRRTSSSDRLFDFQETTLDNGLKVITLEDFSSPIVSVQVWYHVGSKDEDPQRQGFAHMFEHMMFKGTDRVGPQAHFELLRRVGGSANGYTSLDKTVYLETVPADQVELALWLEAERMAFLKIDQESVDTERKVVEEELRVRYDNEPYGNVYKKIAAALYSQHPYRWSPIGNIAHLRASTPQEMRDFWSRYYVPNNATLLLVGAIKHHKAQALARHYFGWIQRRPNPPKVEIKEPQMNHPRRLLIEDEIAPAPLAGLVWRTVPHGHPDELPLDFLSFILGRGDSSRLYRQLAAEKQSAVQALALTYNQEQDGIFAAGAMLSPTGEPNEILADIQTHLKNIQDEGVSAEELEKARNNMLKMAVSENLTIESKSSLLAAASVILGDTEEANFFIEKIHAVSQEDIRRAACKYLRDDRKLVVLVKQNAAGKKDDEQTQAAARPEETAPPPGRPGEKRPAGFPKTPPLKPIQPVHLTHKYADFKLDNGVQVLVVQNHEVPFVSVRLGFPYGAWCEEKPGAASMTLSMLTKGTAGYSEAQLSEELERRAITLEGRATLDEATVSMDCLSEQVEDGMRFLSEIALHPTFDPAEFEKLCRQKITALSVKQKSPEYLADKEFRKRLFGQHPYSRTAEGEAQDLSSLSANDLQTWWTQFVRPEKAVLIFAGDIEERRALALAKTYLGNWTNTAALPAVSIAPIPAPQNRQIFLVHQPGSSQAQIRVGQLGITRHDQPEYFISRIVGSYFGGAFNSRLNQTIRVDKGLTYGAWGTYVPLNQAGYFIVNTFTKTDSVLETLQTIFEMIQDLQQRAPTDTELNDAKTYIAGSFLLYRETPQQIAEDLWLIESQNLGRDYLDKLFETVRKTSRQDCISLVKNTLHPDQMVIVVVGDADLLAEPLQTIAPVTRIQMEEGLP